MLLDDIEIIEVDAEYFARLKDLDVVGIPMVRLGEAVWPKPDPSIAVEWRCGRAFAVARSP